MFLFKIKQITRLNSYKVTFFGTKNDAIVNGKTIELYNDENCAKIITEKLLKRKGYKDAINALEELKTYNEGVLQVAVKDNGGLLKDNGRAKMLTIQLKLLEFTRNIRKSLALDKFSLDLNSALYNLEDFQQIIGDATKFMLCKYPQIVETQKKLRTYIGDVPNWKMTKKDLKVFNVKAEIIRQLAMTNFDWIKV